MNKVLEQDKDHVQALNYLAYTYAELGKNLEDAGLMANRALELQPGDGYGRSYRRFPDRDDHSG